VLIPDLEMETTPMNHFLIVSLRRALGDRRGVSALEYGILAAAVVVAVVAFTAGIGPVFTAVLNTLTGSVAPAPGG
jgi:Flp pilus assembly pilin Flp